MAAAMHSGKGRRNIDSNRPQVTYTEVPILDRDVFSSPDVPDGHTY